MMPIASKIESVVHNLFITVRKHIIVYDNKARSSKTVWSEDPITCHATSHIAILSIAFQNYVFKISFVEHFPVCDM